MHRGELVPIEGGVIVDYYDYRDEVEAREIAASQDFRKAWGMLRPSGGSMTKSKNKRLKYKKYGITDPYFQELMTAQKGKCKICGLPFDEDHIPQIDHDHKCPEDLSSVRGLLCTHCNLMLGHARDDCQILANAIRYLRAFNNSQGERRVIHNMIERHLL